MGPKLLHHVRCAACGPTFNSKTGQSNSGAIVAYVVVTTTIAVIIVVVALLASSGAFD